MLIRQIREKQKITQKELGRRAGVSQNYISDLENDKHEASEYIIIRICIGLGVDPNTLLGWEDLQRSIKENFQ